MVTLMTGVTGILGSVVGPELQEEVFFLVRDGVDNKRIPAGIDPRQVVNGDITKPMCGLDAEAINRLKQAGINRVFHLAANVSFALEDTDGSIFRTNFEGTRNILNLARELGGVKEFHHCSTAFGPLRRNPYENSKMDAEKLVVDSGFPWSIYRPSAMVGDSRTAVTNGFNGYYGVYGIFYSLAQKFRAKEMKIFGEVPLPIYVVCSSTSTINLIQTDWVKDTMLKLFDKGTHNKIFHITHPHPQMARWVYQVGFNVLGIRGVKYLEIPTKVIQIDKKWRFIQKAVDEVLVRYNPYVTYEEQFSLQTVQDALGDEYADPPEITADFIYRLLKYAAQNEFGRDKMDSPDHRPHAPDRRIASRS